jgi:hypothetical protein
MKSNDSHLPGTTKSVRENGTVTLACALTLVLVTIFVMATIPEMSTIIPFNLQHVTIATLTAQVVSLMFSGRREN